MPNYSIDILREVSTLQYVTRVIEADSPEAALEIAGRLADSMNGDCPGDAADMDTAEFGDWSPSQDDPEETDEPADDIDEEG